MRIRITGVLALLPLLTASCAMRAPVQGLVLPAPDQEGRMDDAIVYVESRTPVLDRGLPRHMHADSIALADGQFVPGMSATTSGSFLVIRNDDRIFHRPFSRSPAAPFQGRPLRSRHSRAIRVRSPGMVRVYCELHAREAADVLVIQHGSWTRADSVGRFSLGEIPHGRYLLHAWHPTLGEWTMPLTVSSKGPLTVELRYPANP